MEKSFIADDRSYIPQAMERNYTSSDNSSSININMGGITQNITGQNGEDILDILVEKLVKGINTGEKVQDKGGSMNTNYGLTYPKETGFL